METLLPVKLYGQISEGELGIVEPEAPIGGRYEATVTVVDHVFDAASGTFGVRLVLPNPDLRLPAGVRCKVSFREGFDARKGGRRPGRPERDFEVIAGKVLGLDGS